MKTNLIFLFALLLTACSTDKNAYTVTGRIDDESMEGMTVYMSEYEYDQLLDSAIVADGAFVFKGTAEKPTIARLELERRYYTNFIMESGNIVVDLEKPNIAHGTRMNELFTDYTNRVDLLMTPFRESIMQVRSNPELDDSQREQMIQERYEMFLNPYNEFNNSVFSDNKENIIGTFVLWQWSSNLSIEEMDSLYAVSGDVVKNFGVIRQIMATNEKIKKTQSGMPFVDFTIENGNADGSAASFSDYIGKGKYVLVDFWASWCGPCIAEIPVLLDVHTKYSGDKFQLLGVAVWDERGASLESIEKHQTPWPHIIDAQQIPTDLYGIGGIPQIILFAPDGTIVARDLRGAALKMKVEEVLAD